MKRIIVTFVVCIMTAGCAGSPIRTQWQASAHNQAMLRLQPGMTSEEVIKVMGNPDKTEMYRGKNGENVLVYLYITEGKDITTRHWSEANYTPVVFEDNKLIGWGWNYFNSAAQKYEFTIKNLY